MGVPISRKGNFMLLKPVSKQVIGLFLIIVVLLSQSFAGTAETSDKAVITLEDITVMAAQPGVAISADKTVINMKEFAKPGPVTTLTDLLNEIGGVDVQRANALMASPGDEVSIRGLNEGRMVIEIDGRRINQTGHMGRYIVDWSTLTLDDV